MKDAIMVLMKPYEWRMVIDALMLMRQSILDGEDRFTWSDHEVKRFMRMILLHVGLPDAKRVVPEAYEVCFPEGAPVIVDAYETYVE